MKINQNDYNAIMINATRAFERESWLIEASDMSEALNVPVAEVIEGFFAPFCDRLVHKTSDRGNDLDKLRDFYFAKFTEMVI